MSTTDQRTTNPQLFLCHSHKDKRFVRRLSNDLSLLSIAVWLDEWQLTVGDSLHECIGAALEKAAYVGVVLSPDSVRSRWCQAELDQALTREKRTGDKVVLPLLYKGVQIPAFLEGRFYLDFGKAYTLSLGLLTGHIHGLDQRDIRKAFAEHPPRTVEDVVLAINKLRSSVQSVVLPEKDYEHIRGTLKDANVDIDSAMFEIRKKLDEVRSVVCFDHAVFPGRTLDELRKENDNESESTSRSTSSADEDDENAS